MFHTREVLHLGGFELLVLCQRNAQGQGKHLEAEVRLRDPWSVICGQIKYSHVRHAWGHTKCVRQNLAEMGLAMDPSKAVPLRKRKVKPMEIDVDERPKELVRKPYVLNDLEAEASLPEKKGNTLSRAHYMAENHGEDYKAMARDEKHYYQETPKQIRCL